MSADLIAGWTSGGLTVLLGHPLDTVKARLQISAHSYNGIIDCTIKTVKRESVLGLYKGLFVPFVTTGACNSLLFAGYGVGLRLLHPSESNIEARKDLPMSDIFIATMIGAVGYIIPTIPIELVKTRLQVQTETVRRGVNAEAKNLFTGPWDCCRKTIKYEGFTALYKGGWPIFIRDQVGFLFYFPVYEGILREFRKRKANEHIAQLFAGGCAGITSWISVAPLEVVKNVMQADSTSSRGMTQVFRDVYRDGGVRGLFRGGLAMCIRGFFVNATLFFIYEKTYALVTGFGLK